MMAPRVVCLLAPVPEVNSTRRPSLSASSLLSPLAAHSLLDVDGIGIGIGIVKPVQYSISIDAAAAMARERASERVFGIMMMLLVDATGRERLYYGC